MSLEWSLTDHQYIIMGQPNVMKKEILHFGLLIVLPLIFIGIELFATVAHANTIITHTSADEDKYSGYTLRINEQFNGKSINQDIWTWGDGTFQANLCTFDKEGITIKDGLMHLSIEKMTVPGHLSYSEASHNGPQYVEQKAFRCGELQSKDNYRYGIFEVRMKTPRLANGKTHSGFGRRYVNRF